VKLNAVSVMSSSKCLSTLYVLTTLPTSRAISLAPRSGSRFAPHPYLNVPQLSLGRREELLACASSVGGQLGVVADNQALAWKFGRGDTGHVPLIEQRKLERTAFQQCLDGWRTKRCLSFSTCRARGNRNAATYGTSWEFGFPVPSSGRTGADQYSAYSGIGSLLISSALAGYRP
jgi:hypothetical protein